MNTSTLQLSFYQASSYPYGLSTTGSLTLQPGNRRITFRVTDNPNVGIVAEKMDHVVQSCRALYPEYNDSFTSKRRNLEATCPEADDSFGVLFDEFRQLLEAGHRSANQIANLRYSCEQMRLNQKRFENSVFGKDWYNKLRTQLKQEAEIAEQNKTRWDELYSPVKESGK